MGFKSNFQIVFLLANIKTIMKLCSCIFNEILWKDNSYSEKSKRWVFEVNDVGSYCPLFTLHVCKRKRFINYSTCKNSNDYCLKFTLNSKMLFVMPLLTISYNYKYSICLIWLLLITICILICWVLFHSFLYSIDIKEKNIQTLW